MLLTGEQRLKVLVLRTPVPSGLVPDVSRAGGGTLFIGILKYMRSPLTPFFSLLLLHLLVQPSGPDSQDIPQLLNPIFGHSAVPPTHCHMPLDLRPLPSLPTLTLALLSTSPSLPAHIRPL